MSNRAPAGKGALALMIIWALGLVISWLIVLNVLIRGGWFSGA